MAVNALTHERYEASPEFTARRRLDGVLSHPYAWSPLKAVHGPGGAEVFVKDERENPLGSFKWRGAFNHAQQLAPGSQLITASAGNHALGVAEAAYRLQQRATIFVPETAPKCKTEPLETYPNVEVVRIGETYDDAHAASLKFEGEHIHAFATPEVYMGQGTIMTETLYQLVGLPEENGWELARRGELSNNRQLLLHAASVLAKREKPIVVFAPVGGGGLMSGMALEAQRWREIAKQGGYELDIRLIGVQLEGSNALYQSRKNGQLTNIQLTNTFAEGTAVNNPEESTFKIVRDPNLVHHLMTVSEAAVRQSINQQLYLDGIDEPQTLHEGAGALARAGLNNLYGRYCVTSYTNKEFSLDECTLVTLSSGKNIDPSKLHDPRTVGNNTLNLLQGPTTRQV